MEKQDYSAMIVEKGEEGVQRRIGTRSTHELPEGDVLIRVHYSSLNYKDALSATGHPGVTRRFPHTPGIDAAGTVTESSAPALPPGSEVIAFGFDLGMNTPGGYGEYIRVPEEWVLPLPEGLTLRSAMIYGTAGFTAAYSLAKLQGEHVQPDSGEILVTGASGGVGSVAVALLAARGYRVVAMSGKPEAQALLGELGAAEIIPRFSEEDRSDRPLDKGRWAGVIDTVGGPPLAAALKQVAYDGTVTTCGLAASPELETTVYPFILRDVSLLGVDSVNCRPEERRRIWDALAGEWALSADQFEKIATEVSLEEVSSLVPRILEGKLTGRTLVRLPGA